MNNREVVALIAATICLVIFVGVVTIAKPKISNLQCSCESATKLKYKFKVDDPKYDLKEVVVKLQKWDGNSYRYVKTLVTVKYPDKPYEHESSTKVEEDKCYNVRVTAENTNGESAVLSSSGITCTSKTLAPTVVPTVTESGLIALGVALAGSLAWMIRRRVIKRPSGA